MKQRVGEKVAEQASRTFVGRAEEMALLMGALKESGPAVTYLHGISGIGKSRLLSAFAQRARARGAAVILLDCRAVEPTEKGFLRALGSALGRDFASSQAAIKRLRAIGTRVVLGLDHYEVFRLLDTWLRQVFGPLLPSTIRLIISDREGPLPAWFSAPGWQGLFRAVELDALPGRDAIELLTRAGIPEPRASRINHLARGHPLALSLAASTLEKRQDPVLEDVAVQRIIRELTQLYVAGIGDPLTQPALESASVVRRATISLLRCMMPEAAAPEVFRRLAALPFVHIELDGLQVHDSVKQVIATSLRAADPGRYRDYQRAAWSQLRSELSAAPATDLWRYTADMLYLLENPVIREAFFPTGAQLYAVEPAQPNDQEAMRSICERYEGGDSTRYICLWWMAAPQSFSVVHDRAGKIVGFYSLFDSESLGDRAVRQDPIVKNWLAHLQSNPVPKGQTSLFLRRWLGWDAGEEPSPIQAACWLDIKRTYLALRPKLRRVYLTVNDLATYAPVAQTLGFVPIPDANSEIDGRIYHTAMPDFGPASVDGWLAKLVGTELGMASTDVLDIESRELIVEGRKIPLTKLEFAVMRYLQEREGKAVSREALIGDVWGHKYDVGSNVVDAVVKGLRKKLGRHSDKIETVPGCGYRFDRRQSHE